MSKVIFYFILFMLVVVSCKPYQAIGSQNNKTIPNEIANNQLEGDWRLVGYSVYMSAENLANMPDYNKLKVVYTILPEEYKLIVSKDKTLEYDHSLPDGEYKIWKNRSMLKIVKSLFMYHIDGDRLTLDSNYDPSFGSDGITYSFRRVKA